MNRAKFDEKWMIYLKQINYLKLNIKINMHTNKNNLYILLI